MPSPTHLAVLSLALAVPAAAGAQGRTGENAVTQAEDAFGFSLGRETLGIYTSSNVRGFSPTSAGNVRIEGLYFDPSAFGLTARVQRSSSVRVGLAEQGYPFISPTGVVDFRLRKQCESDLASSRQRYERDRPAAVARHEQAIEQAKQEQAARLERLKAERADKGQQIRARWAEGCERLLNEVKELQQVTLALNEMASISELGGLAPRTPVIAGGSSSSSSARG